MPDRRCEVLLYSPNHDAALWQLGYDGVAAVVELWAERTAAHRDRPDVAAILPFENRGAEVGATIPHPHGQLYAFADVPTRHRRIFSATVQPSTAIEAALRDERIVASAGTWNAFVPAASRWPFGLRLCSPAAGPDLATTGPAIRRELAGLLCDVLTGLDALFAAPMPYMMWVNQVPCDANPWPVHELTLEIAPLYRAPGTPRYVAAAEVASEEFFNPIDPVDAAAMLRNAGN